MSRPVSLEEMVRLFKIRHKTSHMLKIDNFSLLKKYQANIVTSSQFDLGGHKWRLILNPNGCDNDHVALFLSAQDPIGAKIEFEVYVVSQLEANWHSSGKLVYYPFVPEGLMFGSKKLISHADLKKKGYLIGDCVMFGVKIFGIKPAKSGTVENLSLIEKPLNNKVTWKIPNFSSLDPRKVHNSHQFVVGDRKWRIQVQPRGYNCGKFFYISVYLLGEGLIKNAPKSETLVKFKLRIMDQVNSHHVEEEYCEFIPVEFRETIGSQAFMPMKKLGEPYLVKDTLYVGVEFQLISMNNNV